MSSDEEEKTGRVSGDPRHSELRGSPALQLSTPVKPCLGSLRPCMWGPGHGGAGGSGWHASAHLPSRQVFLLGPSSAWHVVGLQ